ncbi:hypothetical protein CMUS01_13487 [Colletotrichum musicola]|uniref:Uncharacterized protein n=1 Tax=Colletotrichum musicola TaxID=2175873 RepID=A0A8H6JC31_9PEZI|nr:hypothetical protein CMUS01_13487 [Colletotrichum musicola]
MSWEAVAQIAVAISIGRGPVRRLFETVPRGRDQQTALHPPYGRLRGLDKRRDGMKGLSFEFRPTVRAGKPAAAAAADKSEVAERGVGVGDALKIGRRVQKGEKAGLSRRD